jgi:hypothetical protein
MRIDEMDPMIYMTYRLHWLPHGFPSSEVEKYVKKVNKSYQIESYIEEYCKEEIMKHVKNGNIRLKLKIRRSQLNNGATLQSGAHRIGDFLFVVTRMGEKPKCLICNSIEHLKSECPELKKSCSKCNFLGHTKEKCTYSLRVAGKHIEELMDLPDEEYDETSEDEKENDTDNSYRDSQKEAKTANPKLTTNEKQENNNQSKKQEKTIATCISKKF